MKPVARHRILQTSALALCGLIFLALTGCALPSKPVRSQTYDLGAPPPIAASAQAASAAPLALEPVAAPPAIDGTQITYRLTYADGGQQPRPYALARWAMTPPQLLTQRLRQALAARWPVLDPDDAGLARLQLRVELDEFAQVFTAPHASEGVLRLRATAFAPGARGPQLLGQRNIAVRKPAATPDAPGAAAALREATDEAVQQILDWLDALLPPR